MKDILKTSQRLDLMNRPMNRPMNLKDAYLILLPALGWILAHRLRPFITHLSCAPSFHVCVPGEISAFDRLGIRPYVGRIDEFSFYAEYAAGFFAVFVPMAYWMSRVRFRFAPKKIAIQNYTRDLVIFVQATFWNGMINEGTRLLIQRPRPFVFLDPKAGELAAHYNSFYSGHTSFSAVAMTSMVLTLKDHGTTRNGFIVACLLAIVITTLTGSFRVLAGRHFPTDVIAGAFFGFATAWLVRRIAQKKRASL